MLLAGMVASLAVGSAVTVQAAEADPRDDSSPWAMCSGAEWSNDFPKFNPLLDQAGIKWLRAWPEWQETQPRQGEWVWETSDKRVANAKANHIHLVGVFHYFAKWSSADGGTRKGPVKDMQFWKDYVGESVKRYKADVKYWEVWNEVNGSFYEGSEGAQRAKEYADLVVAAYDAAKKADPTAQIGLSMASTDIGFLDLTIQAGAAGHFDFIAVHPYENLDAMRYGDEPGFLTLGNTLRQMLAANKQNVNTPLWITEIGSGAPPKPEPKADARQADMLVKSYILPLVQGFSRIFWFEIRGPLYGEESFNLLREDWSPRPSYVALKTMTTVLGPEPEYLGWLNLGKGGHGFAFRNAGKSVLVAWALPGREEQVSFASPVKLTDLTGRESPLAAGKKLALTSTPVFLGDLPENLVKEARANRDKAFPWGGDYSQAAAITCRLGETNVDEGLRQVFLRKDHENRMMPATADGEPCRRVVSKDKDNSVGYFRADTGFVPYGTQALDITVVARRAASDQPAELALTYEKREGYKDFIKGGERWSIPAGKGWQEHTWHVTDACFANCWGWHIGLISAGDTKEFLIKEIRVTKATKPPTP